MRPLTLTFVSASSHSAPRSLPTSPRQTLPPISGPWLTINTNVNSNFYGIVCNSCQFQRLRVNFNSGALIHPRDQHQRHYQRTYGELTRASIQQSHVPGLLGTTSTVLLLLHNPRALVSQHVHPKPCHRYGP